MHIDCCIIGRTEFYENNSIKFSGNTHSVLRRDWQEQEKGKVIMTELKYYAELIAGAIW